MKIKMNLDKMPESRYDRTALSISLFGKSEKECTFCIFDQYKVPFCYDLQFDSDDLFQEDGKKFKFSRVSEFIAFLHAAFQDGHNLSESLQNQEDFKILWEKFNQEVTAKIFSVDDLAKLVIREQHECWDENVDEERYYPQHDTKLNQLARSGNLEALQAYLKAPNPNEGHSVHYVWNVGKVKELAEKWADGKEPLYYAWAECSSIDLKSGSCELYTEYDLNTFIEK